MDGGRPAAGIGPEFNLPDVLILDKQVAKYRSDAMDGKSRVAPIDRVVKTSGVGTVVTGRFEEWPEFLGDLLQTHALGGSIPFNHDLVEGLVVVPFRQQFDVALVVTHHLVEGITTAQQDIETQ